MDFTLIFMPVDDVVADQFAAFMLFFCSRPFWRFDIGLRFRTANLIQTLIFWSVSLLSAVSHLVGRWRVLCGLIGNLYSRRCTLPPGGFSIGKLVWHDNTANHIHHYPKTVLIWKLERQGSFGVSTKTILSMKWTLMDVEHLCEYVLQFKPWNHWADIPDGPNSLQSIIDFKRDIERNCKRLWVL